MCVPQGGGCEGGRASQEPANFPGRFPGDSGGSPAAGAGAGTWTGASRLFATVPPGIDALRTECAASLKLSVLSFP